MFRSWALAAALVVSLGGVATHGQESAIAEVYGKGVHAYFARNYTDGYRYLSEAISAGTQDPRAYYFRGLCLMQLGREPDAKLDFTQGTKLEMAGLEQFGDISRSLERVQGNARRTLETYRSQARMAVVSSQQRQRMGRFETVQSQPAEGAAPANAAEGAPAAAPPANPFAAGKSEMPANPFAASKPEAPANPFAAPPAAAPPAAAAAPAQGAPANPFAPKSDAPPAAAPANNPFAPKSDAPAAAMPAKDNPFAPSAPAKPAAPAPDVSAAPAATPPAASAAIVIPDTPDGTIQTIINEVLNDRPQVIWHALPAKYQEDIKGVIADFGGKMDQELWDSGLGLLGKVVKILKDKKEFILNYPALANSPLAANKDALSQSWDAQIAPFETLLASELATLDGVKALDPEKFLSGTVAKMMKQAAEADMASGQPQMAALKEMAKMIKVTVVSADAEVATVSIEVPGQEPKEQILKKVEGKWLPDTMVDGWDQGVGGLKAGIEMMDLAMVKPQVLGFLGPIQTAADALLAVDNQENFNTAIDGIMALVGPMLGPLMQGAAAAAPATPNNNM
jgi:hypothetical protein